MKIKSTLLALAASLTFAASADAAIITFGFSQDGFTGGGVLNGTFVAEDLNGDGQISTFDGEVISLNGTFTGDQLVADQAFDLSHLFGLVYDLGSGFIGNGQTGDVEGLGFNLTDITYMAGPGPFNLCDGQFLCAQIEDSQLGMTSETFALISILETSEVPLPAALPLFIGGLAFGRSVTKSKAKKA